MSLAKKSRPARGNQLLTQLSDEAYAGLAPLLQTVDLDVKQILHERGELFSSHFYFPTTCTVSAILPLQDGAAVEVGTVGNEGFSGVETLAGAESPSNTYFCQIPGVAMRISVGDFYKALETVPGLQKLMQRYLQGFMSQMAQSVACNSQHSVEARFARWMLITHDRVEGDDFQLTQEFIAQMLGVQRPSVSLIANQFQRAGLIKYSRGKVQLVNRKGIEEVCCECYFDVRERFSKLLGIDYG